MITVTVIKLGWVLSVSSMKFSQIIHKNLVPTLQKTTLWHWKMNLVDAQCDAEKSKHPKVVGQSPDSLCTVYLSWWKVITCTQGIPEGTCHSSEKILYVNFHQYNIPVFGIECLCSSCSFTHCNRLIWCVVCMLFLSVLEPIAKPKPYLGHFMLQCTLDGCHYYS